MEKVLLPDNRGVWAACQACDVCGLPVLLKASGAGERAEPRSHSATPLTQVLSRPSRTPTGARLHLPTPHKSNRALAAKLRSYEYNATRLVPGHVLPI